MTTAKLFKHGGSQAVRLPKEYRFPGSEVVVTRRGDAVILRAKPAPEVNTLADVAKYMADRHPAAKVFPDRAQPTRQQARDLTW
jgi:antitoxin VapB